MKVLLCVMMVIVGMNLTGCSSIQAGGGERVPFDVQYGE
jgi:uncharacterized protein YceK